MKPGWNLPANPTTSKSVVPFLLHSPARPRSNAETVEPATTGREPEHHTTTPRTPRSIGTPAAPLSRSAHPSFPQNDIEQCEQRCGHLEPLCLANPPRPHRTPSFHRNVQQSVPAERQPDDPIVQARRVPAFFAPPQPSLSTLGGRTNEPTSQPRHATKAGSRRHAETRSTLRTTVTHR